MADLNIEKAKTDDDYMNKIIIMLNDKRNKPFNLKTVTFEEMIEIPNNESELVPIPVYINMEQKIIVEKDLKVTDINYPVLKHIFNGETEEAVELIFNLARTHKWDKSHKSF